MHDPTINTQAKKFNKHELIILFFWTSVNIFFLIQNGIVTTGEAEKYIGQAKFFLQTGNLSAPNLWFYSTEIFLIAACIKFHIGFGMAVIFQYILNFIATFYFCRTLLLLFNSKIISLTGTIILLLGLPYQEFNGFLQTESLFYSFTLILSCYVLNKEDFSAKSLTFVFCLLLIVCITRPTGLVFILPICVYIFLLKAQRLSPVKKIGLLSFIAFIFLMVINKAMNSGGEFDFILPFKDEDIICGYPTLTNTPAIKTAESSNSLFGLYYYVTHHFNQFMRLAWLKTIAFFGLYRIYYSKWHNIYLISFYYSILAMTFASFSYWIKNHSRKFIYLLSIILITWLTVILTCDDWHNRFYLGISPYLIILGLGILRKFIKQ